MTPAAQSAINDAYIIGALVASIIWIGLGLVAAKWIGNGKGPGK